ncbi:hypothetical protein B6S12_09350 [Helicobacter valdiviensis]|uniref:DUF2393 domain-containing protein n=1 Tax=Helicobacter valdiviensis TaxID=1458358 RepID=A0A2W6MS54_9HELI|nr:DUF2393 domain-containing protein [Helicobacter valdiviensis]PZT47394.1 hypothetical protein B6S12_09350 [Helicobacter valdiviensis]
MNLATLNEYFSKFSTIFGYLSLADYLVLVVFFLCIVLFFLLAVALRHRILLGIFMFLCSMILLVLSPYFYQITMENYLKKVEMKLSYNGKLNFDPSYYVEGKIKNIGLLKTKGCIISVDFLPKNLSPIKQLKYTLKPFYTHKEVYKTPLNKGEELEFKIIIDNFKQQEEYMLKTRGMCY